MKAIKLKRPTVPATADAVVIKNKKVLMEKRNKYPYKGHWVLPGGFIIPGEKVSRAVVREVKEETGLKVKVKKFIGYFDDPTRDPRGHTISFAFVRTPVSGRLRRNYESAQLKFFDILPKKIGFGHKKILKDAGIK